MAIPGTEITWQGEPLFVVGATDAGGREVGPPLYIVRGARIRSDSGLVIVQHSVQSLLVFERDGVLRETVGADGDGPGEFRRVRSVTLLAEDSMLAWDYGLKRISVFDRSRELSEVISLTDMIRRAGSRLNLHMVGTETIVTVSTPRGTSAYLGRPGLSRDEHTVQFLDRQGREVGMIDRIQGWEMYRGERSIAVPYSYRLHAAGGHRELFAGDGRGQHLTQFAITGEPAKRLQLPIEREALRCQRPNFPRASRSM